MENKEQQILSEIKAMMASIRSQLELLDAKMAELQQAVGQEEEEMVPIDLELDDIQEDTPVETPAEMPADAPVEIPVEDEAEPVEVAVDGSDEKPAAEPEPESEPAPEPAPAASHAPKPAVIDSMTDRQAWRTDMPGTQVKDIRSAISLNDRILFINMLFNQDPMAFQDALTKINQMAALDEAVNYIVDEHPDWDMESETVYRFMMAVRRKIR